MFNYLGVCIVLVYYDFLLLLVGMCDWFDMVWYVVLIVDGDEVGLLDGFIDEYEVFVVVGLFDFVFFDFDE